MRTLHLFAGAGGGLIADLILGHEPVCAVEWDPYCCQVLRERSTEGWFPNLHVWEGDVRLFHASEWKGRVDCIHAGFPCQPHSIAGKRKGHADDRNLWPEVVRVVGEIQPRWVFLENVPGIISNGFVGTVLCDLARLGYDARWTCLGADQVGAPHRRERWWCLAYAGREHGDAWRSKSREDKPGEDVHAERCDSYVADSKYTGRERGGIIEIEDGRAADDVTPSGEDMAHATGVHEPRSGGTRTRWERPSNDGWWETEPDVGRVVNGVASRVDRLKALGNGQVSLQAALAWRILSQ